MSSRQTPPPSTGFRLAVERRSATLLVFLTQQPKLLLPIVSLALLIGGLALPPVLGAICLGLLLLIVAWLSYLSWPAIVGQARAIRLLTLGVLVALIVQRFLL